MHGTTKAIFIAAAALQASANPLFNRQASSSSAPISSIIANITTTSYSPTATVSSSLPTPSNPTFPFPGGSNGTNGTYYICSFPSTNDTVPTTAASSNTESTPLVTASSSTETESSVVATLVPNAATTTRSGAPITTSLGTITSIPVPTPTATPFTVVGPSSTLTIECIQIPGGNHPHPPPPGPGPITASTSATPLPNLPTLTSIPPTSRTPSPPASSTI